MQHRFCDPLTGRFLQSDTIVPGPMNPQSLNRYNYVLNNPLRYVSFERDPTRTVQTSRSQLLRSSPPW